MISQPNQPLPLPQSTDIEDVVNFYIKQLLTHQIVTIPTETVEGLAVSAHSQKAVNNLMLYKERDFNSGKIFTLVPESTATLSQYVLIPSYAKPLIQSFIPGELTLILPKNPNFHHFYYDHFDNIGIRIPNYPLFSQILPSTGPLILTSANKKGGTPKSTTGHLPSTIIDCTTSTPYIIRQGNLQITL